VTANAASSGGGSGEGGGVFSFGGSTVVVLRNSILARNTVGGSMLNDCLGQIASQGYNLVGVANTPGCLFFNLTGDQAGMAPMGINPMLGPLQNNGGATE